MKNTQRSAERVAVTHLLLAASMIRRQFEVLCVEQGLTFQQFSVLRILREAIQAGEGPLPTMEVAERMIEAEPGITRMMTRLERMGFVRRERSETDARVLLCRLTRKAHAALRRLEEPIDTLYDSVLHPLPQAELQKLTDLLERGCGQTPKGIPI